MNTPWNLRENKSKASKLSAAKRRKKKLRSELLEKRNMLAVVINEIHFNSEDNTNPEEFVELHNTSLTAVDISGWEFTDGIEYTFPGGTTIPAEGYIVVSQDPATLLAEFGAISVGPYSGNLSGQGENVELRNAVGTMIDEVDYKSEFPWPIAAAGDGGSMELINPSLDNNLGSSWRSSYIPPMFGGEEEETSAASLGDLVHRWSFDGDLTDSVGGADGTLVDPGGIATYSGGQLDVSANNGGDNSNQSPFTSGAYVDLPNGIISALGDNATFEWWGTVDDNHTWAEIFSFGNSSGGEDTSFGANNNSYLTLIPRAVSGGGDLRVAHRKGSNASESSIDDSSALAEGFEYHIAVVWDGGTNTQSLYVNGSLVGTSGTIIDLDDLNDVNNWLGRSQWADTLFDGFYNEFRIYNRPLSGVEVATSYLDGPDIVVATPQINSFAATSTDILYGESITLSWDVDDFTQLSINEGIGDVTGITQTVVTPTETTTYTLTATNAEGDTSRNVTIVVNIPKVSPGLQNFSYATNAAPNIRQVEHSTSTTSSDTVVITSKVTDADGVDSVTLEYQVVLPGQYLPSTLPVSHSDLIADGELLPTANPDYFDLANWTSVIMVDDGTGADAVAGDDIYSAAVPSQLHRTLVRYRVTVEDTLGAAVTAPFADDASLNFAYFVYDGVPDYEDNSGTVLADAATINSVPVYHFLTRSEDIDEVMAYSSSDEFAQGLEARFRYNWAGTMVYNGVVYDNIHYRLRGANGRYLSEGKRSMRFRFNDGSYFQAHDQDGIAYPEKWRTLTTGKGFDNHQTLTYGLNEAVSLYLSNLIGLPAANTHSFQFRVIDDADESPDQWNGDFWGLNFAIETYDKRFLDTHGLESGNLYKLINQSNDALRQQRYQATDAVNDGSDHDYIEDLLNRNSNDIEERVNLEKYYLFHALVEMVRHYDFWASSNKNMVYYFEPDYTAENDGLGKLWLLPWDTDASWGPTWNFGEDVVYDALFNNNDSGYSSSLIGPDYYNALRELRDLVWQPDQIEGIVNEIASALTPLEAADRARWQNAPSSSGNYDGLTGAGATSISALVQDMLNFAFSGGTWPAGGGGTGTVGVGGRAAYLDSVLAASGEEALVPNTPSISYIGDVGMGAGGLEFQASSYSDPQGNGTYAAVQWRIAEVTAASAGIDPNEDFKEEWVSSWDSGALTSSSTTVTPPSYAVTEGGEYRARVRYQDDSGRWSHWSDPIEFTAGASNQGALLAEHLRISELNYHPHDALTQFGDNNVAGDKFEFIEFINTSATQTLSLAGVQITGAVTYTFEETIELAPGERVLVVENVGDFESRYGTGLNVVGKWSGGLSNSSEEIVITDSDSASIQQFTYFDNWHKRSDGDGSSLVIIDTAGDYDSESNWRPSTAFGGTPDAAPLEVLDVVINEVTTNNDANGGDAIEFFNTSGSTIDLTNWWLSDTSDNLFKYQIGSGTTLAAGGFLVFDESDFNAGNGSNAGDFTLSAGGDEVWLVTADGNGEPERFADVVKFDAALPGVSLGRVPDGVVDYGLFPLLGSSIGSTNGPQQIQSVLITEVNYHPTDPSPGSTITAAELEFVELYNPTASSIDLSNWQIDGGVELELPLGTTLGSGQIIVLVNFDHNNSVLANEFRAIHGIDGTVTLLGDLSGQLANSGEEVRLLAPTTAPAGETGPVYYLVDRVTYRDDSGWATSADGQGDSLHRTMAGGLGDYAASWNGNTPTPGSVSFATPLLGDYDLDRDVDDDDYTVWVSTYGSTNVLVADGNNDGKVDAADYTVWRDNFGATLPLPVVAPVETPVVASIVAAEPEIQSEPIVVSAVNESSETVAVENEIVEEIAIAMPTESVASVDETTVVKTSAVSAAFASFAAPQSVAGSAVSGLASASDELTLSNEEQAALALQESWLLYEADFAEQSDDSILDEALLDSDESDEADELELSLSDADRFQRV